MVWPKEGYFWSKSSLRAEEVTVPTGLERKGELGVRAWRGPAGSGSPCAAAARGRLRGPSLAVNLV